MRTGVIAKKVGMTRIFSDDGRHQGVTVLDMSGCQVVSHKTSDRDGYDAVQLGIGEAKLKRVSRSERTRFATAGVTPKQKMVEFRVDSDKFIGVGKEISASHFVEGQFVDASSVSIGRGFTGAMKRWNFSGLRATHGVSVSHRSLGGTGGCQDPGRTYKGKKMHGRYGGDRVTVQNLKIVAADEEKGILLVEGAIPGAKGSWVELKDAVKRRLPENAPMPGAFRDTELSKLAMGALDDTMSSDNAIANENMSGSPEATDAKGGAE